MTAEDHVSTILQSCEGRWVRALLSGNRTIRILNIAWGRDISASHDHITTNVSPSPPEPHTIDFFVTSEVLEIRDETTSEVLFRKEKGA
jgi:hypothetical protein